MSCYLGMRQRVLLYIEKVERGKHEVEITNRGIGIRSHTCVGEIGE